MPAFSTRLVHGDKSPYLSWLFLEIPPELMTTLGPRGPVPVCGTIEGVAFRGMLHRSPDGSGRVAARREWLAPERRAGDVVAVVLEKDLEPRTVEVPEELAAALAEHPDAEAIYAAMAPSHRRAWAEWVGSAKQASTRQSRAARAPEGIRAKGWPR
jgi:hypothetical protein